MALKLHHLNCDTDCPFGGALMDGHSQGPLVRLVRHRLLIETDQGLCHARAKRQGTLT